MVIRLQTKIQEQRPESIFVLVEESRHARGTALMARWWLVVVGGGGGGLPTK
jgi:hypothetical protein